MKSTRLNSKRISAYTLLEVLVVMAILGILATATFLLISPQVQVNKANIVTAVNELTEIGKAIGFYALDNQAYPADVGRGVPPGIGDYINEESAWPDGPLEGSLYDYDNWSSTACVNPAASGSIQITLRNVPDRNPDGSDTWAWYYVLQGTGTPHCQDISEADLGECINCEGFDPFSPFQY